MGLSPLIGDQQAVDSVLFIIHMALGTPVEDFFLAQPSNCICEGRSKNSE